MDWRHVLYIKKDFKNVDAEVLRKHYQEGRSYINNLTYAEAKVVQTILEYEYNHTFKKGSHLVASVARLNAFELKRLINLIRDHIPEPFIKKLITAVIDKWGTNRLSEELSIWPKQGNFFLKIAKRKRAKEVNSPLSLVSKVVRNPKVIYSVIWYNSSRQKEWIRKLGLQVVLEASIKRENHTLLSVRYAVEASMYDFLLVIDKNSLRGILFKSLYRLFPWDINCDAKSLDVPDGVSIRSHVSKFDGEIPTLIVSDRQGKLIGKLPNNCLLLTTKERRKLASISVNCLHQIDLRKLWNL